MSTGTIATVCARGGSKGLPGKNLRPFLGRPLIAHTIAQARACTSIDAVYVSTDDEAIAAAAREAGAVVPFLRPAALATDESPKLPVLGHLVAHLEQAGVRIERVVDLQPTSPLRHAADIEAALALAPLEDLVVSVCRAADNPYFNLVERGADGRVRLCQGEGKGRRQDLPEVLALNGSIYVWRPDALKRAATAGLWGVRIRPYVMPRWKSVDVDDLEDFELAEWLGRRHAGEWQAHG